MKVFFLDTNIFLQYKDLKSLPWAQVSGQHDSLLLLIPRPVQRELDRLKQDGNGRRAKRARLAKKLFDEILDADDSNLVIKNSHPHVVVLFSPVRARPEATPDSLDLSLSDDMIVAEALVYKSKHPNEEIVILTGDTGMKLTAKTIGIDFLQIPDEWLLPPEPDPRDKRLQELEHTVKALQQTRPQIEVYVAGEGGVRVEGGLTHSVISYEELSVQEIDSLAATLSDRRSMWTREEILECAASAPQFSGMMRAFHRYEPPTDAEIREYHEQYEEWISHIRESLGALPSSLSSQTHNIRISITLENLGSVPAENLVAEFKLFHGVLFVPPASEPEKIGPLPKPPTWPQGRWRYVEPKFFLEKLPKFMNMMPENVGIFQRVPDTKIDQLAPLSFSKERDKHAFYWKPAKPRELTDVWAFDCAEFRHRADPERFDMVIHVPPGVKPEEAVLMCRVTAKNLPEPVNYPLRLKISTIHGDILAEARKVLDAI